MRAQGQTLTDLRRHFHASDPTNSGLVELDELRQILRHFGCHVSYFRFNDVARLLFRLHGTCVAYAQVERLLELAAIEDHVWASTSLSGTARVAPHYMHSVITEEAEGHGRDRCSTVDPWRGLHDTITPTLQPVPWSASSSPFLGHTNVPMLFTPVMSPFQQSPAPVMASMPVPSRKSASRHYVAHL